MIYYIGNIPPINITEKHIFFPPINIQGLPSSNPYFSTVIMRSQYWNIWDASNSWLFRIFLYLFKRTPVSVLEWEIDHMYRYDLARKRYDLARKETVVLRSTKNLWKNCYLLVLRSTGYYVVLVYATVITINNSVYIYIYSQKHFWL